MKKQKVAVIGLGYVGLPLLVALAETEKYIVVGFDVSKDKIAKIEKGENPIDDELVDELLPKTSFEVSADHEILSDSDFIFIAVPTPVLDDYTPDYSYVISAGEVVSKYIKKGQKIVLESTVNPGTTEEIFMPVLEKSTDLKAGKDFHVGYCPERIDPNSPNWTIKNISRNLGATSKKAAEEIRSLYKTFIDAEINVVSSIKVAEATKIVENAFRDVNIAFVNELAQSFDKLGIDVLEVINGASNKPFGYMPFYPSLGVGGHCIPVDPYYLIKRAAKAGFDHRFLKLARDINNSMPEYTTQQVVKLLNELEMPVKNTKITILGVSYKANVGDLRESPVLDVIRILDDLGADLKVYDPLVEGFDRYKDVKEAVDDSVLVLLGTDHLVFLEKLNPSLLASYGVKAFVDGRNKFDQGEFERAGMLYKGIGR